jgi:hypothetical protein
VAEHFSLPRMVDRYIQIYARAASADPPSSE